MDGRNSGIFGIFSRIREHSFCNYLINPPQSIRRCILSGISPWPSLCSVLPRLARLPLQGASAKVSLKQLQSVVEIRSTLDATGRFRTQSVTIFSRYRSCAAAWPLHFDLQGMHRRLEKGGHDLQGQLQLPQYHFLQIH